MLEIVGESQVRPESLGSLEEPLASLGTEWGPFLSHSFSKWLTVYPGGPCLAVRKCRRGKRFFETKRVAWNNPVAIPPINLWFSGFESDYPHSSSA